MTKNTSKLFIVQKLLDKRKNPKTNKTEYLVKWKGYPSRYDSWEPYQNIRHIEKKFFIAYEQALSSKNLYEYDQILPHLQEILTQKNHSKNIPSKIFIISDTLNKNTLLNTA